MESCGSAIQATTSSIENIMHTVQYANYDNIIHLWTPSHCIRRVTDYIIIVSLFSMTPSQMMEHKIHALTT